MNSRSDFKYMEGRVTQAPQQEGSLQLDANEMKEQPTVPQPRLPHRNRKRVIFNILVRGSRYQRRNKFRL